MKQTFLLFFSLLNYCLAVAQPLRGDLMPIRLGPDSTIISIRDLIGVEKSPYQVIVPEGLRAEKRENGVCAIFGNMQHPVGYIHFEMPDDLSFDLIVKKSLKEWFTYRLPDPKHRFENVQLAGDFNGWTPSRTHLEYDSVKGEWKVKLLLDRGQQAYRLHIDGVEQLDTLNPLRRGNGLGGENSYWQIGQQNNALFWNLDSAGYPTTDNYPLFVFVYVNNKVIWSGYGSSFKESGWKRDKRIFADTGVVRIYGCNWHEEFQDLDLPSVNGTIAPKLEKIPGDKHEMMMYFMMLDRFKDGNPLNNPAPLDSVLPQAQFLGGDLVGLESAIATGYFDSLHFNTLWISPITQNPSGAYGLWDKGGVRTRFSSYHGYWPISFSTIDPRFGKDQDLHKLLHTAHQKDYRVLLDYVAHHVHEEHPLFKTHPDWVTPLYLPDGSLNTERWDEYRLTTWFDVFLPTLDLGREEVTNALTDSALSLFKKFDLDGLRHDATKHVPLNYWKTLTWKLRTETDKGRAGALYQIGETYGSHDLISSYLSSDMLDAQFDFNLYDRALETFAFSKDSATEANAFASLKSALEQSLIYYGAHHLMGNISGNQDKPRFMALADGSVLPSEDTKLAGYVRDIQVRDTLAYRRLALMHAFNFSIPGIPIVYYGDEIGMTGGNDPDNRRMMRFDSLTTQELTLRNTVSRLAQYREQSAALKYGNTRVISGSNYLMIIRSYIHQHSVMIISRSGGIIAPEWPEDLQKLQWKTVIGESLSEKKIQLNPESFILLETK
ncbi:MAG: alpha-amylase [Bacteroidota bacterium]|nr:alpha-amylase [Bacteroidota bacterium]MDX5429897.1 alpha-amylase [Bacteroidota bacterium]MDX5468671.1 alpha-amylase [Bacteroidota bacterium]